MIDLKDREFSTLTGMKVRLCFLPTVSEMCASSRAGFYRQTGHIIDLRYDEKPGTNDLVLNISVLYPDGSSITSSADDFEEVKDNVVIDPRRLVDDHALIAGAVFEFSDFLVNRLNVNGFELGDLCYQWLKSQGIKSTVAPNFEAFG